MFHLLKHPDVLAKVKEELLTLSLPADRKIPSLRQVEQLPYLSAVIKEGLRLHGGIVARSQRISRNETLRCAGYDIPPGTPLSCSSYFLHRNPEIFPEPTSFRPERWLDSGHQLDRYLVAFGKGTRNCVGKNLGQAELYLTLAAIIPRFAFSLVDTDERDVEIGRDWYVMQPLRRSEGVRAMVTDGI